MIAISVRALGIYRAPSRTIDRRSPRRSRGFHSQDFTTVGPPIRNRRTRPLPQQKLDAFSNTRAAATDTRTRPTPTSARPLRPRCGVYNPVRERRIRRSYPTLRTSRTPPEPTQPDTQAYNPTYSYQPTAGVDTQRRIHIQRQQQRRGPVYRERDAHISVLAPPRNRIPLSTGRLITLLLAAGGARRPDRFIRVLLLSTEQAWDCSLSLSLSLCSGTLRVV